MIKKCTKCGIIKLVSDFSTDKKSHDNLQSQCKNCKRIWAAKYRKTSKGRENIQRYENSFKRKEYDKQYNKTAAKIECRRQYEPTVEDVRKYLKAQDIDSTLGPL